MSMGASKFGKMLKHRDRVEEIPDPFDFASQTIELEKKLFGWKIYTFVPMLVCVVFISIFMFSPLSNWLVSQSNFFLFLFFDATHTGFANLLRLFVFLWFCTTLNILLLNILMINETGEERANPWTYINSRVYTYFINNVYDRPSSSAAVRIERKQCDESQAYQYTGRPVRRKVSSVQNQSSIIEELEPTQCSNFDLPEFDPDGPNPFGKS